MKPRRKEQMQNLVRELRMHNRHQDALVEDKPAKPRFTYSIEWDDGPYWDGWNVRCVETGQWMRSEGFSSERKAQDFLEQMEGDL